MINGKRSRHEEWFIPFMSGCRCEIVVTSRLSNVFHSIARRLKRAVVVVSFTKQNTNHCNIIFLSHRKLFSYSIQSSDFISILIISDEGIKASLNLPCVRFIIDGRVSKLLRSVSIWFGFRFEPIKAARATKITAIMFTAIKPRWHFPPPHSEVDATKNPSHRLYVPALFSFSLSIAFFKRPHSTRLFLN